MALNRNKALGGAIALLGAAAIFAAAGIGSGAASWGPRMVPTLAGLVMLIAGLAIAFERIAVSGAVETEPGREGNALWLVVLTGIYLLAVGAVGYLAATAIAAPVFLVLFGTTSPKKLFGAAILCPSVLHIFFFELLGIFPPRAAWFDLADLLGL